MSAGRPASRLLRLTPQAAFVALAGAAAWVGVLELVRGMGQINPTMGVTVGGFIGAWTLMMAALMLPSVAPFASLYARSISTRRWLRLALFALGYLAVWAATGLPAYALSSAADGLAMASPTAARLALACIFLVCAAYQLSPVKRRCLEHCRSPLSLLLHYVGYRSTLRDLRAGLHHGAYCLGCCWSLMLLLIALGAMNLPAMLVLACVILLEKWWSHGLAVSRGVGVGALAMALAVLVYPRLAAGLTAT